MNRATETSYLPSEMARRTSIGFINGNSNNHNQSNNSPLKENKSNSQNLFRLLNPGSEDMSNYQKSLGFYLSDISCHHELLVSESLARFLDEELASMFHRNLPGILSPFDILLIGTPTQSRVVNRLEEVEFRVPANSIILWQFTTIQFDIGFSVDMEGVNRLPLTRYNAHEHPISGALETKFPSVVRLIWNNSYSKCKYSV